jgi:hypothetical protein
MMAITLACDRHHSNGCFRSHDFAICRINFALEGVMEQRLPDEPKGWRKLQAMAQKEHNPEKLAAIIERINRLLTAHEKKSLSKQSFPAAAARE